MQKERIFGLDIMRFAAIITVLIGHLYWIVHIPVSIETFEKFSIDGVSIFFTLSGFLIGNILFRKLFSGTADLRTLFKFWKARWWRTLPAYYFILLIILGTEFLKNQIQFRQAVPYFFFLQNLHSGIMPTFGVSWSLTIEEWFYLTAPVLFLITAKYFTFKKAAPLVIALYFVAAFLFRFYKIQTNNYKDLIDYALFVQQALPTRIDAVMFGVLGAYLSFYNFKIWTDYRKILFIIGFIGFFAQHEILFWNGMRLNNYIAYWYKSVELLFSLCMIPYLSTVKTGKGIFARFISFTAVISYSIYLVHGSIYSLFFASWLPDNIIIRVLVYLAVAFGLGYLNYLIIEKWGIRQRGRINENPLPKS